MQRFSSFLRNRRVIIVALAAFAIPALLSGCSTATYAPGPDFSPETHDYLRADDSAAYAACTAMCAEDTALALVTRTGCLEGCLKTRDQFTLHGKTFTARQDCLETLLREDLAREKRIAEMKRWCDEKWSHVHNRKGCYMAAEKFYASLAPGEVCGTDAAENARYGQELRRAREEAAKAPPEPEIAEPVAPVPPPQEQPAQMQKTAPAPQPQEPPSDTPGPVTHSTQPAGPLDPPPYAAPESSPPAAEGNAAQPDADPVPAIRDTPKYQKAPPAKAQPVQQETPAEKPKAETAQPAIPQVEAPKNETPAPAPALVEPPQPVRPNEQPQAVKPNEQPQTGRPEQTAPPEPQGSTPEQKAPKQPVPEQPKAEAPPAVKSSPVEVQAPPAQVPAETVPARREGPPVPGLNANRPAPPPQKNDTAGPGSPTLMPPVPSMLNKPYEAPTIISPQIDVPSK